MDGAPDDQAQAALRSGLRRMRTVATCLLVAAVAVYVATSLWHGAPGWVGYVRAGAEAGTVGALADWFAVTALFRHPLGLPIPHTAIIRKRKDDLGRGLESFVATHFLAEPVVRGKVAQIGAAARVGDWLRQQPNADRVSTEVANRLASALEKMNDALVVELVEKSVLPRLVDVPWAPVLGALLDRAMADGLQHRAADVLLDHAQEWLVKNPDAVRGLVLEHAPVWSPRWVDEAVANKVYTEAVRLVGSLRADRDHRLRQNLDGFLADLARKLRTDASMREKVEEFKTQALASPAAADAVAAMWSTAKGILLDLSTDEFSVPRRAATTRLASFGEKLTTDPELAASVNQAAGDLAARAVNRYKGDIAAIIGDTVASWEPAEASRRIELQVGRDLQFIRINGTVVGALAGLLIHLVTELVL
ncbi:DUF445 domain-containing protein [Pseudofrankia inefficax]|uniref:Transmembrane protein n=1 Tax=Pseudofrankia inefficax (strain DSM 45817 / CECT 9037 / DDB 130130 / EuI1c) TaxID=298654 RepID=E3J1G4_PSEI1|nr:DUF445 domain-containing protein [Pseudofrankia inefficax]ADP80485.1 protein of unknown function DUF445 [Pseudofrankia inefficax]